MIKATASNSRPTSTDAPSGVDVDISATLTRDASEGGGSETISGTITLVPDADDDRRMVAYGSKPEHWVSSGLLREIRMRESIEAREILDRVLEAGVGEAMGLRSSGGVSGVI